MIGRQKRTQEVVRGLRWSAIALLTIAGLPSIALAQGQSISNADPASSDNAADQSRVVSMSGPIDREASGFGGGEKFTPPMLELSAEDDQIVATIGLAYAKSWSSFKDDESGTGQIVSVDALSFGLEASAPFNGTGESDAIDFRHLGNDAELTMSLTWFSASYPYSSIQDRDNLLAYKKCMEIKLKEAVGTSPLHERSELVEQVDRFQFALNQLVQIELSQAGPREMFTLVNELEARDDADLYADAIGIARSNCLGNRGPNYIFGVYGKQALGVDGYRLARQQRYGRSELFFAGAEVSLGYETHDILDRALFQLTPDDKVGIDSRAYVGIISGDGSRSGRLSAGYARGYEAQDVAEFCIPVPGSTEETCISGEDGVPQRTDTGYVSLEGRIALLKDDLGRPSVAIAPEITYQIDESDFLFDLPIFFSRAEDDSGLSGGIRAAYDTGEDDFSVRLFIGVPFSNWF